MTRHAKHRRMRATFGQAYRDRHPEPSQLDAFVAAFRQINVALSKVALSIGEWMRGVSIAASNWAAAHRTLLIDAHRVPAAAYDDPERADLPAFLGRVDDTLIAYETSRS